MIQGSNKKKLNRKNRESRTKVRIECRKFNLTQEIKEKREQDEELA